MSVEDFNRDWKIDWANKIIICVTPSKTNKYNVSDFWRCARKEEASPIGMAYEHIVDTDGMGPSYNVPRKIRLANGYKIDPKSLKYLMGTDSTLLDQMNNVLIPDALHRKRWWENSYVQGTLILIAILGLILTIITIIL